MRNSTFRRLTLATLFLSSGALAPVLSAAAVNVPTPGCAAVLTPGVLDDLRASAADPLDVFEAWRQKHPNMIEVSMPLQCRHEAWMVLHGLAPSLDQPTPAPPQPLAPSVGADIDMAGGVAAYQGEVSIAVDPNNPLHLVAGANSFYRDPSAPCQSPTGGSAATYGTQALYGSTDGGSTWTYNCAPWNTGVTGGVTGATAWFGSDPAMAYDASGNAYAVYMLVNQNSAGTAAGSAIVISKSTNNGASWSNLGVIVNHETSSAIMDDKEMVAIDTTSGQAHSHPGRIYVIWDENNVERVAYSDNGSTWTTVVMGSGTEIGGNVAVGPDGTVWAAWNRYSTSGGVGAGDSLYVKKSTDGGVTWTAPHANPVLTHNLASFGTNNKPAAQNSRGINAFPIIDVDRNAASASYGRLYIAYCDFPPATGSGNDLNVYLVRSSDSGVTWSSQVKVNDDAGTTSQFFPWMAVDQADGAVNLSWVDTRNFSANNRQTQEYGARSVDGGVSFEANLQIEDSGANFASHVSYSDENATDNASRNANQYGDYTGIAALNRLTHPIWTDSRNLYPTSNGKAEDAASSEVTFCTPPTGVPTPSLVCGTGSVVVSWGAVGSWGTNATSGTYNVIRFTDAACTQNRTVVATNATSPYTDSTVVSGTTYYYEIQATNNCPGTALTPMSATSSCSGGITCSCVAPGTPAAGNNGPICAGGTLNLTTPTVSGATYSWTGPNGFVSTLQNPSIANATTAATGAYHVTITVGGCTSAAGTTSATVNAVPATPTAGNNGPICAGGTLNLTAPAVPGASYSWTGPNSFASPLQNPSIANATAAATGTYNVTVTLNGCTSVAGSTSATVNARPATPTASNNGPICAGSTLNLTTPTVFGATYSWTGPNGFSSPLQNPSIASATAAATGTYNVTVTVNGCASAAAGSTSATVNSDAAAPVVTAPAGISLDQTLCCGAFGGVTPASSTTLNAFVNAGSATDNCTGSPTRLPARVGTTDITSATCFGVGTTAVTFRFQDGAGNIGTATANVTVRMFGDLNGDLTVDASDLVVLRDYLDLALPQGTPPFTAPLNIADVNHDTAVDASDLVRLRGYLNLAVSCLVP